jgi:hypothetical protein
VAKEMHPFLGACPTTKLQQKPEIFIYKTNIASPVRTPAKPKALKVAPAFL